MKMLKLFCSICLVISFLSYIDFGIVQSNAAQPNQTSSGPDLTITRMWVEPATPQVGQVATIYATVLNQGNQGAGHITKVKFVADEQVIYYPPPEYSGPHGPQPYPPQPPGNSFNTFAHWTPTHAGENIPVRAWVDYVQLPPGDISESDESNNYREIRIDILPAESEAPPAEQTESGIYGADLQLMERTLEFSAPAYKVGKEIKIAVKVKNTGTKKLAPVEVAFWADEQMISEAKIGGLAPGEKGLLTIFWTPRAPGRYTIYAIADPNKRFDEKDEGNNRDSREIRIGD